MTTAPATAATRATAQAPAARQSLAASIALHLAPGLAMATIYVLVAPLAMQAGWPPLLTLSLLALVVLAPLELGHLLWIGRRAAGRWSLTPAVSLPPPARAWRYAAATTALVVVSIVLYALSRPADLWFARHVVGFLPRWFDYGDPAPYRALSPTLLYATLAARFAADIVVIPATEELYFRGYLLPRLPAPGWLAPILNAALFAAYHAWQPYNWPSIFLFSLPMIVAVWLSKDLRFSLFTHIIMNLIGFLSFAYMLLHA